MSYFSLLKVLRTNLPTLKGSATQDNADCVLTFAASANNFLQLTHLSCSYSADPATPKVLLVESTSSNTVLFKMAITSKGAAPMGDVTGLVSLVSEGIRVTLPASGTAGTIGYLNASARVV